MIDPSADTARIADASKRIAVGHIEDGCDKSGWIQTKLLRVPGALHTKTETHHRVTATFHGDMYSLEEIEETYADVSIDEVDIAQAEPLPTDLPNADLLSGDARMTPELWTFWITTPELGADLSAMQWRMELDLFRAGFSAPEVFVLMKTSRVNKYAPKRFGEPTSSGGTRPHRTDPDGDLWKEVQRASVLWQDDPVQVEVAQEDVFLTANQRFLTDEEEQIVANTPSFIKEYVEWASSRTDAAPEYHRVLGFLLLASVYGDRATLHMSFGMLRLNLWVMLLGDTTKTRKSTARRLMLDVIHDVEEMTETKIDVGSDFTPEALTRTLGERDGMSSLVHRDEVQGYFKELLTKNHQSGAVERMTDLYDGRVPVVLRNDNNAAQKNRSNVVFNMLLMGIADQTARILTADHFRSGFLTRFLWTSAPNLEMTDDRLIIKQGDPANRVNGRDPRMHQMAQQIYQRMRKLPRSGEPIYLHHEALERINKWLLWMTRDVVPKTREPGNLEPSVQRMAHTLMKCAALLAIHDGEKLVRKEHVLIALKYGEEWFETLRNMAESIADSEFGQAVNDIETFVHDGGDKRLMSTVYSKFRSFPKKQVDEWVESLVHQGRAQLQGQQLVLRLEGGR